MKLLSFSILYTLSLIGTLRAEDVTLKGHRYPRQVEARGVQWRLRGAEHYVYRVFFSVFTGAYYEQANGEGKRLRFTYTRNLKAKDLRDQAMKHLREVHDKKEMQTREKLLREIQQAYVDVKKGDSYTITAIPGKGAWLELNGKERFATDNGEFGLWYLNIWLGDPAIDDSLKQSLTSGENL